MNTWTIIIVVVGVIIALLIKNAIDSREKYKKEVDRIDATYGAPTKSINLSSFFITNIKETIRVYEAYKLILIDGELFNFRDIVSVSMAKNEKNKAGDVTIVSQKSTAGTIGRATLGKLVAGNTGAIIGAGTAKTRQKIHKNEDEVETKYIINVTVNSIKHPLVRLELEDSNVAQETYSLLEVICNNS